MHRKDALDLLGARLHSLPTAVEEFTASVWARIAACRSVLVMSPHSAPQVCVEGAATRSAISRASELRPWRC